VRDFECVNGIRQSLIKVMITTSGTDKGFQLTQSVVLYPRTGETENQGNISADTASHVPVREVTVFFIEWLIDSTLAGTRFGTAT
jgi:hypothetical protein